MDSLLDRHTTEDISSSSEQIRGGRISPVTNPALFPLSPVVARIP
jgi:hypothetical protein